MAMAGAPHRANGLGSGGGGYDFEHDGRTGLPEKGGLSTDTREPEGR